MKSLMWTLSSSLDGMKLESRIEGFHLSTLHVAKMVPISAYQSWGKSVEPPCAISSLPRALPEKGKIKNPECPKNAKTSERSVRTVRPWVSAVRRDRDKVSHAITIVFLLKQETRLPLVSGLKNEPNRENGEVADLRSQESPLHDGRCFFVMATP